MGFLFLIIFSQSVEKYNFCRYFVHKRFIFQHNGEGACTNLRHMQKPWRRLCPKGTQEVLQVGIMSHNVQTQLNILMFKLLFLGWWWNSSSIFNFGSQSETNLLSNFSQVKSKTAAFRFKECLCRKCELTRQRRDVMKAQVSGFSSILTARKRSLGQGNVFTPVCQSFCSQ